MTDNNFGQNILDAIKEKHLKPKPKWQFLLRDSSIWALSALTLVIGSLAFAVVLHMVINNDWDIYSEINDNLFKFIFATLPYFWIIILVLLVGAIDYNLKHTKRGYRYDVKSLALLSVVASIILGGIFYNAGLGAVIDNLFSDRLPIYRTLMGDRHGRWAQPGLGFLGGMVTSIESDNKFTIRDPFGNDWTVLIDDDAIMIPLKEGLLIRLIGEVVDDGIFKAKLLAPTMPNPGLRRPKGLPDRPNNYQPMMPEINLLPLRSS